MNNTIIRKNCLVLLALLLIDIDHRSYHDNFKIKLITVKLYRNKFITYSINNAREVYQRLLFTLSFESRIAPYESVKSLNIENMPFLIVSVRSRIIFTYKGSRIKKNIRYGQS